MTVCLGQLKTSAGAAISQIIYQKTAKTLMGKGRGVLLQRERPLIVFEFREKIMIQGTYLNSMQPGRIWEGGRGGERGGGGGGPGVRSVIDHKMLYRGNYVTPVSTILDHPLLHTCMCYPYIYKISYPDSTTNGLSRTNYIIVQSNRYNLVRTVP